MRKRAIFAALFLAALAVSASGVFLQVEAGAKAWVSVSGETRVSGEEILLGDIAGIKSDDPSLAKRLGSVVIGRAPLPGQTRAMKREQIELRLKQNGISMDEIDFTSPPRLEVLRDYIEADGETVEKIVREFILKEMPWGPDEVNITGLNFNEAVILPRGDVTYQVLPQPNEDYLGSTAISVLILVDGKPQKKVWLNADIEVYRPVVLTTRPLSRFHVMNAGDVKVERKNIAQLSSNILGDASELVGKRIKTALSANTPLRADMLELTPLVKRGDVVNLVVESNLLRVVTVGMVEEQGRRGETVRVVNMNSRREVFGKVIDEKTVKVDY